MASFSELYLKPGDRGELVFTVENYDDSVDLLDTPHVVYENQPQWFSMGGVLTHGPLAKGTSCELLVDYAIAANAPSGTSDLKFKVVFSSPNVYPPVWYPAANEKIVVDGSAPSLAVIQPQWFGYAASTTVVPSGGVSKIVRGPAVSFTAYDADSDIADFQIYDSSGQNLSAEYLSQTSGGISYSGNFAEGQYSVSALNKSGLSTTGKVYVDYTPEIAISTFTTTEASAGHFTDTFVLSARSYWGLGLVKLLPATFSSPDPLDASAFDDAIAVREFNGNGVSSATVVFQDIADGDYAVYAKNSLGSLSAAAVAVHSVTSINPETGSPMHSVQYANPSSVYGDGGVVLSFGGKEKFTFNVSYGSVAVAGLNFVNSVPVVLPETISASYFTFPYGFGFTPKTSAVFTGDVSIRIDYRKAPFSQYQKENARLYAYVDGAGWQNITSQAGDGWITGTSPSLAKLALVFPYAAAQPYLAKSSSLIGTAAEAEFSSYFSGVALSAAATDQAPIADFISVQETKGKYLVSDTFLFSYSNTELVPPGALRFRYLATQLSRFGVSTNTLDMACAANGAPLSLSGVINSGADVVAFTDIVPQVCGLFAASKPKTPDMVAPESYVQYDGVTYAAPDGGVYVGPYASLRIYANDSAQAGVEMSGVSEIYYGADLSSGAIAAVATGDFSAFITFRSTFSLLEGTHTVTYFATDKAGNTEPVKQAMVYADYSGPEVALTLLENQTIRNGTMYTSGVMPIVLNANDPQYAGVASGTSTIKILWDKVPEDCPSGVQYDPQQPWGTCANPGYHPQLNIPAGRHSLAYWAEDNVGNSGEINLQAVFIDTVAPDTTLYIGGVPRDASEIVIPQASSITLTASDPVVGGDASGIKQTWLLIDRALAECTGAPTYTGPQGTCDNPVYKSTFTLSPGTHTVYYFSQDNAGNSGWGRTIRINCSDDATPPETTLELNGSIVSSAVPVAALTTDSVTISAIDPTLGGTASGVKDIYFLIDISSDACGDMGLPVSSAPLGSCQNYLYAGAFSLALGTHTVYYTASDNVGNVSPMKTAYFTVSAANPNAMPGGYIRRVAGNGQYGNSADGVPALDAKFGGFYGVVKSRGSVFMVDYSFSVVRKIAPDGKVYTVAGTGVAGYSGDGGPATAAMLNKPNDIAIDSAGNIYIADRYNNKVRKVDAATGIISTALDITSPLRVAVDNNDTLYVADGSKVIYKILPDGQRSVIVNGQISSSVGGLAFDANNNLYIADTYNKRIRKVDPSGTMTTVAGGGSLQTDNAPALQKDIGYVADVAVAKDGGLLFLDGYRIYHLDPVTGLVGTILGDGYANVSTAPIPVALTYLSFPQYICIDETGLAYITGNGLVAEMAFPGAKSSSDASVRFYSGNSGVRISSAAAGSAEAAAFLAAAGSKGLLPASTIYAFTNSGTALSPDGGLVFKYDPNVAKTTSTLALYAFDGVTLSSAGAGPVLAEQLIQPGSYSMGKFVAARAKKVPYLVGLLMEVSDDRAPRSALTLGQPSYGSNPVYVSSMTSLTITAEDDKDAAGDKKGLGIAYVMVRVLRNGVLSRELRLNNPSPAQGQTFAATFALDRDAPGAYSIEYYAVDLRGNREGAKIVLAALDTTPPGVELQADGAVWQDAENFSSLSSYEIRLVSTDSLSGIASQRYLVDIAPEDCVFPAQLVSTAPAGTCQNPIYVTPVHLGVGTHRIYISAEDNVGNRSQFKRYTADVRSSWYSNINAWPYYEYRGGLTASNGGQFSGLVKIGFDPKGNVWIGEGAGRISVFDADGNYLRTYSAGLTSLRDFSVCPDGTFWALAYVGGKHLLEKLSASGEVQKEVEVLAIYNAFPRKVACDNSNRPVVAVNSSTSGAVMSFDGNGNYAGRFELGIPQGIYDGLATDSNGNIFVADLSSYVDVKIKKFSKTGEFLASIPLTAKSAGSIDLDAHGNIYVTDNSSSPVGVYTSTGGLLTAFGDLPVDHQMKVMGQPVTSAVHPYTGKLYVGTGNSVSIYGEDHTPPNAPPQIMSPVNGVVLYSSAPLAIGMAEAASYVNVFDGGVLLGAVQADRTGQILSNMPGLSVGRHLLRLENADLAGNKSAPVLLDVTVKPVNQLAFSGPVLGPLGPAMSGYGVWDTSATVVADFDRDGRKDVLGFSSGGKYTFYKGSGSGTYSPVYTVQMPGMTPQYSGGDDAVAADFDGDGLLDISASVYNPFYPYSGNDLMLLKGKGDGTFADAVTLDHLIPHSGIAAGDFNKDGYPDIAAAAADGNIRIYFGGPGSLFLTSSTPVPTELPSTWRGGVAIDDVDGDGRMDIVFRNSVLYGDPSGGFDTKVIFPYSYIYSADTGKSVVADFNQDGLKDVGLVSNEEFNVFIATGRRAFQKSHTLKHRFLYTGSSADFNRDGVPDVVISPYRLENMLVLAGRGDGTFEPPIAFPTGGYAQYGHLSGTVAGEDLNSDGKPDILQASSDLMLSDGKYLETFFAFLNTTSAPDTVPPAAVQLAVRNTEEGGVELSWIAPGNDGATGIAWRYDLRYGPAEILNDAQFAGAQHFELSSPRTAGSPEKFTLGTLGSGTSYYFALKTYDAAGNVSELSNSPGLFTKYVVKATTTVDGNPEIAMVSAVQPYISYISTLTGSGAVAIGTATAQALTLAGNMYEIAPEGVYDPPATLTFYYSTSALAAVGLAENEVFVYEHFAGTGWVKLAGQVPDPLNHKITVPITRIASLFGIFGVVKDKTPPETTFAVTGSSWPMAQNGLYVHGTSSITLTGNDPVAYGTAAGVAFTEFRVDASTSAPFARYLEPFSLSTGAHKVEFRSADNAGNIEEIDTRNIFVDGAAPDIAYALAGATFAANGTIYAAAGSTVALGSSDEASGVGGLFYEVNGSTFSEVSGRAQLTLSVGGAYSIAYSAVDNVGNVSRPQALSIFVDTTAPVSAVSLDGSSLRAGWYTSVPVVKVAATDDNSGVKEGFYSLDGSTFAVVASSFQVLAEGRHNLGFYSVDNVLNAEHARTSAFGVDLSTPMVSYSLSPLPNASGWNHGTVDVIFNGTDTVSGIAYCSSSFTVAGEGKDIPASGYCSDYAGWSSTVSFTLSIDTTAPVSLAEVGGMAGQNSWLRSPAAVALASIDNLSGVAGLQYAVDGSSFAAYSSSFTVRGSGHHELSYFAADKAGNIENVKHEAFKVDLEAPAAGAQASPQANPYGWNNSAVTVVFAGTDSVSGLAYCEPQKTFELEGTSQPVTGYCMDYAGWSSTASLNLNIDTTSPRINFTAVPDANSLGWNNGDISIIFTCADELSGVMSCPAEISLAAEGADISTAAKALDYAGNFAQAAVSGLKIDRTPPASSIDLSGPQRNGWYSGPVTITLVSTDALSGVKEILYILDGSTPAVYNAPLVVTGDGEHTIKYHASDNADNLEVSKSAGFRIDASAPAVGYTQTPAQNSDGWNNSAVDIIFVGTDPLSGIEACSSATVALEGQGISIPGWCRDLAGNVAYATATVNVDVTRPGLAASAEPQPNASGWNNGDVRIKYACEDGLSGVSYCPSDVVLSGEGVAISTQAVAYDHAGNASLALASTVKIDRTAPVTSVELAGVSRNGWYSGPVTATLVSSDELSGVKEILYSLDGSTPAVYRAPLIVAGDGEHTLKYYASDNAGNLEGYKSADFRIDAASPAVGYRQAPAQNSDGWNNSVVNIIFVGTDTLSGIEGCSSATVVLEGQGISAPGWCRDLAGNVAYATATVNIDVTRPGLAASAEPQSNAAGWNNDDVRIKYACEDGLSGVSYCPPGVVLSGEGVAISTQAIAYDHAGNASLVLASTVKIDRTVPVSSVELSGVLRNGWYSGPVGLAIKSADALAGVKEIRYILNNSAPAVYAGPVLVPGEGAHTLTYYAEDNADNIEETHTAEFRIDSSSPVVSFAHTPQANAAGWNNTVVAVAFAGEDGLSGIEACSSTTVDMEGRGVAVPGWCRDLAGNVAYTTATLNIDLTPAAIKIDSPLAGQTYIATRGNININVSIKDNLDPAPLAEAFLVQTEDRGSPRGTRPARIAVTAGQSIEPLDIDDGLWRLDVSAADAAGNTSAANGGLFEVIHDMVPPRSSLSQTGPAYRPAGTNYLTSAAVFTVSSLDDLVAAGDGLGLGVISQGVKLNAGATLLKELAFTNARPAQGEAFVSTFGFAGLPDGLYSLLYSARDVLSNVESSKDWSFALDNTQPVTQYNVNGVAYEAGGKVYINSTASIGLAGVDVSSGGVASGLMVIKLRLDGGTWGVYSSTFAFATPGDHLLEYQSMDNVQNAEAVRRLAVVIDNIAPLAQATVGEPQYEVFGLRIITPETPVTLSAADQGDAGLASGVKSIHYELRDASGGSTGVRSYTEPIKLGIAGTYVLRYWAVDNAGNSGAPREQRLMVSSLQGDALDAVNGLELAGNADIAGAVKSNGVVSLAGNARILGDVSASTITLAGNARITGQRFSGVTPLVPAPLYMPVFVEIASNTNSNALIPAKYLVGGKLVMDAKAELTLSTGVYYFTGIDLKGGASVVLNGKVDILVAGDVSIAGGSSFNAAGPSIKLNIFISTASSLGFAGGGNLAAYVYAPYADLKLTGNALLGGHYFVKNAFVSGNGNILQAGESLPVAVPAVGGGGKKVSAMAAQDGTVGVLAGPSAEFRLGEVYVFPNPALRGAAPTFHVEVGIADRVKITIYTVSGRQALETTLTGLPAALDDGNGLSYAYEYTWGDSIPSGVYFYHIEAEKNGQKIKKSGKFGVVR